jgi:hypothetical protein
MVYYELRDMDEGTFVWNSNVLSGFLLAAKFVQPDVLKTTHLLLMDWLSQYSHFSEYVLLMENVNLVEAVEFIHNMGIQRLIFDEDI